MKSKTSFFKTALKKDLTRFAPAWILYTLCMLLGLLLMADMGLEVGLARAMAQCIQIMSPINLCYGLVAAQLLFGDLFNGRLCFGLHTLPLKREGWFAAHVLSGIFFSLVPTAVMSAVSVPFILSGTMVDGWQIPLYWLLGVNLQYLFFFGVGVFSMLCSGNRFGSALIYGIVNFGSMLCYYMVDAIYTPMLFGLVTDQNPFILFGPVVQFVEYTFLSTRQYNIVPPTGGPDFLYGEFTVTGNWWYLFVCAGLGLALMGIALAMYRKRDLERAGDLMATKKLNPVFLVIYSLACATVFQMVVMVFIGYQEYPALLFVGLTVGYFTGSMLLQRSTRVFRLKNWLGLLGLAAAVGLSLLLTALDPLGIETRIPDTEDIAGVTLRDYMIYGDDEGLLTDREDIENIRFIHQQALEDRMDREELWYGDGPVEQLPKDADWSKINRNTRIVLTYHLKNGSQMTRTYYIWTHQEEGQLARQYFSSLLSALGVEELVYNTVESFSINGYEMDARFKSREDIEQLLEAIRLDSEAGTLAQNANFHPTEAVLEYTFNGGKQWAHSFWVHLVLGEQRFSFNVYADTENILNWITSRDIDDTLRLLQSR